MQFHAIRKSVVYTLGTLTLGLCSQASMAQTNKVVGYIPSYSDMRAVVDRTDLSRLTHINLSFANPTPAGAVASGTNPLCMLDPSGNTNVTGSDIAYVVNKAHAAGVKVSVSVAGGGLPPCSGNWRTLLSNSRQTVVNNYVQFVNSSNLDGIDIDIEGDLLTSIDSDGNYTPFIQALKNALPGKLVTAATANYNGGMIPESSFPYFDFVGLMSYDAVGPWSSNTGGEQSTYQFASDSINQWVNKGLPKSKIILGVPFYGYGFGGMPESMTFAGIVAQYGASAAQTDYVGNLCAGCSYITYNGIPTIRKKAQLAKDNIGGIMIWELSQDASGSNSLLGVIASVMGPKTSSTSSSVASSIKSSTPSSVASSVKSSVAVSSVKSSSVASSVKPSSSSVASNSSSSVSGGQQCNWWGTYYAICTKVSTGWGWENNKDCVSASTCATLPAPYGIVGTATSSVASSVKSSVAASSTPKSSSSSASSVAAFSLVVQAEAYANMSGVQLEATSDVDGVQNVGWIDTGDWMAYTNIVIPTSGSYRIDYRVASLPGGGVLAANLNTNAVQFPAVAIPATGDWQKWTTVSQTVTINAGTYTFGIYASAGNWNINWIKFTKL